MTIDEKLREIRDYLSETFLPATDFTVTYIASPDKDWRYHFHIHYQPEPSARSRRLTIPRNALDDLHPNDFIALLQSPSTERRWKEYGVKPFPLQYDVADRLFLPDSPPKK